MGRSKFSEKELEEIASLLRRKNQANRAQQKEIRHRLRVHYEFNISDFNEPGKAFGEHELQDAVRRGAICILDEATIAAMIGNFQDGSEPGKMQFGAGWWFNDQLDGMRRQMDALSHLGLLSRFVGMLTDSRSFLSYPRHEYFRRLLCDMIGQDVENGLLPDDEAPLARMVEDIAYNNARRYFRFYDS